jgi:hypothetical protein
MATSPPNGRGVPCTCTGGTGRQTLVGEASPSPPVLPAGSPSLALIASTGKLPFAESLVHPLSPLSLPSQAPLASLPPPPPPPCLAVRPHTAHRRRALLSVLPPPLPALAPPAWCRAVIKRSRPSSAVTAAVHSTSVIAARLAHGCQPTQPFPATHTPHPSLPRLPPASPQTPATAGASASRLQRADASHDCSAQHDSFLTAVGPLCSRARSVSPHNPRPVPASRSLSLCSGPSDQLNAAPASPCQRRPPSSLFGSCGEGSERPARGPWQPTAASSSRPSGAVEPA